jgi:hypothetical protein
MKESLITYKDYKRKRNFAICVHDVVEYDYLMDFLEDNNFIWGGSRTPVRDLNLARYIGVEGIYIYISSYKTISWSGSYPKSEKVVQFNDFFVRSNMKKIERPDQDPYNEEDWGYETNEQSDAEQYAKFQDYYGRLKAKKEDDDLFPIFKVGDEVTPEDPYGEEDWSDNFYEKMTIKFSRFSKIQENSKDEEIIYMKNLYEEYDYVSDIIEYLKPKIIGHEIKIQKRDEKGGWKDFIFGLNINYYIENISGHYNDDLKITLLVKPKEIGWVMIDENCILIIKPIVRVFSKSDPYGEEVWEM